VPSRAWDFTIAGYQVIKKWLTYRERDSHGRPLRAGGAREVRDVDHRIAALLVLEPALDATYEAVRSEVYEWTPSAAEA
jgi:hypothetical protein